MIASRFATNLARVRAFRTISIAQPRLARIKLDFQDGNKLAYWNYARKHTTLAVSKEELISASDTTDHVKVVSPELLEACRYGDEEIVEELLADPRVDVNGSYQVVIFEKYDKSHSHVNSSIISLKKYSQNISLSS